MEAKGRQEVNKGDEELEKRHRRQTFWQILLPVGLASLLVLLAFLWIVSTTRTSGPAVGDLSHTATVLVSLPVVVATIAMFILLVGLIVLLAFLYRKLPGAATQVLGFLGRVQAYAQKGSASVTQPVIGLHSTASRLNQVFASLEQRLRSKGK